MLFSRDGHTASLLPGGHVLIVGGYDGDGYDTGVPSLTDAEDYDPSTGSFTPAGRLVYLREGHTATLLPDGRVLIAGGTDDSAAELYIPPLRAVSAASLNGTAGVRVPGVAIRFASGGNYGERGPSLATHQPRRHQPPCSR